MSGVRVLCVDDNPSVCEALRLTLSRTEGLDCVGVMGSADGLPEAAQRERPRVVVMDLDMPGPEPFAMIRELRERCPTARVVVFTGHVRDDLIDKAFDAGVWGYVAKDGPVGNIVSAIRQVADGKVALELTPHFRLTAEESKFARGGPGRDAQGGGRGEEPERAGMRGAAEDVD
jgi:DNA-binding NarL/FixJ family response regulator